MPNLTYKQRYDLAVDRTALERLSVAVVNVAKDVYTEDAGTANHLLRLALVAHAGPEKEQFEAFTKKFALAFFALNGDLHKDSTDQELADGVAAMWTAYAQLLQARGTIHT